jgi:hypothetical protein
MSPQKAALQTVSEDDWSEVLDTPELLEKVSRFDSLPLLAGSAARADFIARYSTDVTTHSLGILANNRKGALRKDLTRGLDDQYEQHLSLRPQVQSGIYDTSRLLYSDRTQSTADRDLFGDSWSIFHNYYNLYKTDYPIPSSSIAPANSPVNDAYKFGNALKNLNDNTLSDPSLMPRVDRFLHLSSITDLSEYPTLAPTENIKRIVPFGPIRPAIVQIRFTFGITTQQNADATGYTFRLHVYPAFVICNPYNIRLEPEDYRLEFGNQDYYSMDVGTETGIGIRSFGNITINAPTTALEPGQVMLLGMGSQQLPLESNGNLTIEAVTGDDIDEDGISISISTGQITLP